MFQSLSSDGAATSLDERRQGEEGLICRFYNSRWTFERHTIDFRDLDARLTSSALHQSSTSIFEGNQRAEHDGHAVVTAGSREAGMETAMGCIAHQK